MNRKVSVDETYASLTERRQASTHAVPYITTVLALMEPVSMRGHGHWKRRRRGLLVRSAMAIGVQGNSVDTAHTVQSRECLDKLQSLGKALEASFASQASTREVHRNILSLPQESLLLV